MQPRKGKQVSFRMPDKDYKKLCTAIEKFNKSKGFETFNTVADFMRFAIASGIERIEGNRV